MTIEAIPIPGREPLADASPAARDLHAALRRLQSQLEVIGELSRATELLAGDVEGFARQLTERAAHATGCARVNVWLFDDDETVLRCIDCFELTPGRHTDGMILEEREYRNEFRALKTARSVAADDALHDPRTIGYVAGYVAPLGITSMLDTVIHISGKHLGLLCFEHVGTPHRWEQDEIAFAGQLADKLGIAVLSRMRRGAEEELRVAATALKETQHLARLGSWTLEPATGRVTWSDELHRILGRDPALAPPTVAEQAALLTPASYRAMTEALADCAARRVPYVLDLEFVRPDGSTGWMMARGAPELDRNGVLRVHGTVIDITERKLAERELRRVQEALAEAQAVAHVGSWQIDLTTSRLTWSEESARIFGDDPETPPSFVRFFDHVHPDDRTRVAETFRSALESRLPYEIEHRIVRPDGTVRLVHQRGRTTHGDDGAPLRVVGTVQDVTSQRHAELALIQERDFSTAVVDSLPGLFVMMDGAGRLMRWNANVPRQSGLSNDALQGRDALSLVVEEDRPRAMRTVADAFANGSGEVEIAMSSKDGEPRIVQWSGRRLTANGKPFLLAVGNDVTERRRAEEQIRSMARHDALTGLANRAVFVEALHKAAAHARRTGGCFAVLYLDIDHFKDVNDTLGHPVGDLLLRGIAQRLRLAVREEDTVARFGGDEFAIVVQDVRDPSDAATVAETLLRTIAEPFSLDGNDVRTGTSVGIALYGPDSPEAEALLSHADVALYRAKAEGRGTYRFFTESMDDEVRARVTLGVELRSALVEDQLILAYQPQVDVETGRVVGLEALARWNHPTRGIVPPAQFIPAAERCGLIVPVGRWVLREACRQTRAWLDAGLTPPMVAVNVSSLQMKAADEFERMIAGTLDETGLPPELLELEITESVLVDASRDLLVRLRKRGLRVAIDDFGLGYSSLGYLSRYPVDRIKIAQCFVLGLTATSGNAAIVKAAIGLAHELGLDVVVEGIETAEQLALIRAWGAPKAQGFLFAEPLAPGAVPAFLRAARTAPAIVHEPAPPALH